MMPVRILLSAVFVACSAFAASAHEFWIDPEDFTVAPGEPIVAHTRVGQGYEGNSFSYLPRNTRLFEIAQGGARTIVESRIGDRPAMTQAARTEGLAVILHVTADYDLIYNEFQRFADFVRHKDAAWTLEVHAEKGFPTDRFGELYSRYAKSLVKVGNGVGEDRAYGLLTEIVALANPYTDDVSGGLPVQVLYQDAPRPEAQVEIFEKAADGTVTVSTVKADASGVAVVPVVPGRRYMLDAVVLREPDPAVAKERDVVWESLWANLTFEVPSP